MDTFVSIFIAYLIFLWVVVELRSGTATIFYKRNYRQIQYKRKDNRMDYWLAIIVKAVAVYVLLRFTDFEELKSYSSESLQFMIIIFLLFSIGHIAYLVFSAKKK